MPRPASASVRRDSNRDRKQALQQQQLMQHQQLQHQQQQQQQPPPPHYDLLPHPPPQYQEPAAPPSTTVHSSLLQPRVAVALGLSAKWHPFLFACRLLSCLPAAWWGIPVALGLLAQAHLWYIVETGYSSCGEESLCLAGMSWLQARAVGGVGAGAGGPDLAGLDWGSMVFERRLRLTETALGVIWCFAAGYLSFFFTDCLMSRWLVNYTPQATLVRLLTINAMNLYLTSWVLHLTGGSEDPRLFLPAWITIATTLTGMYHILQRKINIRKETSMSISVFSAASFLSMVALLAQLHLARPDRPTVPGAVLASRLWVEGTQFAVRALEYGNGAKLRLEEL